MLPTLRGAICPLRPIVTSSSQLLPHLRRPTLCSLRVWWEMATGMFVGTSRDVDTRATYVLSIITLVTRKDTLFRLTSLQRRLEFHKDWVRNCYFVLTLLSASFSLRCMICIPVCEYKLYLMSDSELKNHDLVMDTIRKTETLYSQMPEGLLSLLHWYNCPEGASRPFLSIPHPLVSESAAYYQVSQGVTVHILITFVIIIVLHSCWNGCWTNSKLFPEAWWIPCGLLESCFIVFPSVQ